MSYVIGNVLDEAPRLEAGRFRCVVTSPPYWKMRDYGHPDQLGLEDTPAEYVARQVEVFRAVRRVLANDGTLWLNIGDSYAASGRGGYTGSKSTLQGSTTGQDQSRVAREFRGVVNHSGAAGRGYVPPPAGLKPKDLVGIPWRLAFALQDDGWFLRSDIIWSKPNPMPENVRDRPSKAHEYVFLFSKSRRYYYDGEAISTPLTASTLTTWGTSRRSKGGDASGKVKSDNFTRDVPTRKPRRGADGEILGANARTVWTIGSKPYKGSHFATMPPALAERCIRAGSRVGDEVFDPFLGSGTTGQVAEALGRRWFGIELQADYEPLIKERTARGPLFGKVS